MHGTSAISISWSPEKKQRSARTQVIWKRAPTIFSVLAGRCVGDEIKNCSLCSER